MSAAPDALPFEAPDPAQKRCPICRKPVGVEAGKTYDPFCSKRCADVDLHRWFGGVYAVPADEPGQIATPDDDEG